jgi:hypothetical protein
MTWKGYGRKRPWSNRGTIPESTWRDWGIPRRVRTRKAGVPAEIRTEHLPDTSVEGYRCDSLLGNTSFCGDAAELGNPPKWFWIQTNSISFNFVRARCRKINFGIKSHRPCASGVSRLVQLEAADRCSLTLVRPVNNVTCMRVRVTKITGSSSDGWIY